MRSGGGKDKGSGFEREICEFLSLWISEGTRKDVFWRSASSGGRSTIALAHGKGAIEYAASDIAPVHPLAYRLLDLFAIECKFYGDLHLQDLPFPDRVSNIATFWKQVQKDSASVNRQPLLVAKQNRKPILLGSYIGVITYMYQIAGVANPVITHSSGLGLALTDFKMMFHHFKPHHLDQMHTSEEYAKLCF